MSRGKTVCMESKSRINTVHCKEGHSSIRGNRLGAVSLDTVSILVSLILETHQEMMDPSIREGSKHFGNLKSDFCLCSQNSEIIKLNILLKTEARPKISQSR